jgi:hypothetical protein
MPPECVAESQVTTPPCSVISFTDTELMALIHAARRRLVVIAPGLSESVARALIEKWHDLGPAGVHVVLDPDPEVCRLGFGELAALQLLQGEAERIGSLIHQQQGLRIGVIVTDETTAIYSPTPLLIEAGGRPGEKPNAIRFEMPILDPTGSASASDLGSLNLHTTPVLQADVQKSSQDLAANPPVKFDVAQKVRVFNARIEFVEFELRGLSVSRKTVRIPADIMGLAKEPKAQKLLTSSAHLIADNTELSGDRVNKLKQFIAEKYLITLPGYGTAILRSNKANFQVAVKALEKYVRRFQRVLAQKLQTAMDANRELLVAAFLPTVIASPPGRWKRLLGDHPSDKEIERLLRTELTKAFGSSQALIREMNVKAVFKGVTYESLNDPEFMRIAGKKIPSLEVFHDEYDAAKAQGRLGI